MVSPSAPLVGSRLLPSPDRADTPVVSAALQHSLHTQQLHLPKAQDLFLEQGATGAALAPLLPLLFHFSRI